MTIGSARPRPQAQVAGAGAHAVRPHVVSGRAELKSLTGSGSKTQQSGYCYAKEHEPARRDDVTIGLGPCSGPDPYAKHATLKGECVSGTWFPRVRKTETKRQQ